MEAEVSPLVIPKCVEYYYLGGNEQFDRSGHILVLGVLWNIPAADRER